MCFQIVCRLTKKCAGVADNAEFPNQSHSPQPGDFGRSAVQLERLADFL